MFLTLNFVSFAGVLIAASSLFMAVLMISLGDSALNRIWSLFCLSVFVWGISFYFIGSADAADTAQLWWRISHIGVVLIPVLFVHFVFVFLRFNDRVHRALLWLTYLLGAFFLGADLFTNALIDKVQFVFNSFYYDSPPGTLYLPFVLLFQAAIIYGHYLLLRAYLRSTDPVVKEQIRHFFMATFVGFLGGSISFLPVFGFDIYPTTIITVTLYPIIMGYAILRLKLFDLRLATAQIVALLIFIFSFIKVFTSSSTGEFLLNGAVLLIALLLGLYLVQSVRREIEQREQIQKLAVELQATNERQEGLLHFIGHEVKNALTKDAGSLAALSEGDLGPLPERVQQFVSQALAQARNGIQSVTDILTASNQKRGTLAYKNEPFDLKEVVTLAVERTKPAAVNKNLALTLSVGPADSYQMRGDKGELCDHVLRNLIDNAVNYTPSGSITVSLKKENGKYIVAVKDTGVGITDEDKKLLFTEGGHGKDSRTINVHSTGYGLYIAKNIVAAHNGTIRAESEGQGKGSTFIVELPA